MENVSKIIDNVVKGVGLEHTPLMNLDFDNTLAPNNLKTALFINLENRIWNCAYRLMMRVKI